LYFNNIYCVFFYYRLQAEKRNLSSKAEEVGEMQGQNSKMLEDIETLGETHKYVYDVLTGDL
jgi:hypothetical protein